MECGVHRLTGLFCLLFILTHSVNKYVLSVLHFTFPTIFQGWQTLVGAAVLQLLITLNKVDFTPRSMTREDVALWLPGMLFFAVSIYAGSKALAVLPVPVFFAFQNLCSFIHITTDLVLHVQVNPWTYVFNMVLIVSTIGVAQTSNQGSNDGYFWACCHVFALGAYNIYNRLMKKKVKLRPLGKLYSNYVYSMILFAPSSYFLGEALEAAKYPQLYFAKFYVGCVLSGVFGVMLSQVSIQVEELVECPTHFHIITTAAKIMTSLLSLFVFPFHVSFPHALWLTINMLCSLLSIDFTSNPLYLNEPQKV